MVFNPIAFAFLILSRQYSRGIRSQCISPEIICNGLPSNKKSWSPSEKVCFDDCAIDF